MREVIISTIAVISIFVLTIFTYNNNADLNKINLSKSEIDQINKLKSGISIKDIGEIIVIEQKQNDASVIIDKEDLDDIIVFLNNSVEK